MTLIIQKPTSGKLVFAKSYVSPLWTPAQISTALWLDAADASTVTVSSDLISQVNDKSGNARNFTASGSARPTYTSGGLNGQPVFTFSGSQWLTTASAASTWTFLHYSGSTIVAVWKVGTGSNPNAAYGFMGNSASSSSNTGFAMFFDDRTAVPRNEVIAASAALSQPGFFVYTNPSADGAHPPNTPVLLSHVGDPENATAANRSIIRVNGGAAIANNSFSSSPTINNSTYNLQIGATGNSLFPLTGYIAELIVCSSALNATDRQRLEGYMAWRWGLSSGLPADHPYKSAAPTI